MFTHKIGSPRATRRDSVLAENAIVGALVTYNSLTSESMFFGIISSHGTEFSTDSELQIRDLSRIGRGRASRMPLNSSERLAATRSNRQNGEKRGEAYRSTSMIPRSQVRYSLRPTTRKGRFVKTHETPLSCLMRQITSRDGFYIKQLSAAL